MSYILDALRRADQERQRSVVPTVHTTQQLPTPGEHDSDSPSSPWVWGLALGALALGTLALWAWWSEPHRSLEPPPPTAVRGPARSESLPPAAALPLPPAPELTPYPPAAAAPAAPVASMVPSASPRVAAPSAPTPARAAASGPRLVQVAPPPQLRIDNAPVASNPLPTPLPPNLKTEWSLNVDGAIYSDRPADRLLIVGGQLLREGETLREGVVVETIQPKAAVLRHKGQRYTVSF